MAQQLDFRVKKGLVVSEGATVGGALTVANNLTVGGTANVTGAITFSNNVVISGNLTVSGSTTYVNTAVLNVADNIVTLNADWPAGSAPTENAGFEVNRGTSANVSVRWNEASDVWEATNGAGTFLQLHAGGTGASSIAVDNSNGVVLQDIALTIDGFGHVTGATTASVDLDLRYLSFRTINAGNTLQAAVVADLFNDTLTLANGSAIDITTNATSDTITFAHSDTSSATNVAIDNAGGTVLQDLTVSVDGFGHVTAVSAASANLDTRYALNAFANIAVSGQSTIVADTTSDVLTLVGAGGLTITTDAASDTITFSAPSLVAGNSSVAGILKVVDSVSNTDTLSAASASSVKTAYDRAGTAYANATSYADTVSSSAGSTAYSNAVSYTNTMAGTAYANATSYAASAAGTAYANATSFASNASNISSGTLAVARGGSGNGNFTTAGLVYANGTTNFTVASGAQIATALGTTNVANATYAVSAGSAGSVTNGVYTTGNQTIGGAKTFSSQITGTTTTGSYASQNTAGTAFFTEISQSGSSYAPAIKIKSSGAGTTCFYSFGALHNIDNTIDAVVHGINLDGTTNNQAWRFTSAGDFISPQNVTAYSDIKLKTDLQRIPDAVEKVQQLTGYTFDRIDSDRRQTGLVAQEVLKVMPEAVVASADGTLSVAYGNLVGLLVEAIKELKQEIEDLRSKMQ